MILYLTDTDYCNRIKRFMQLNYQYYRNIVLCSVPSQFEDADARCMLTDDLTYEHPNMSVHYIVDHADERPNYHYKYQNFQQLIQAIDQGHTMTPQAVDSRMIIVTSLVGGAGKSTIAQAMAEQLSKVRRALYIRLLSPSQSNEGSLSDCLINAQHNQAFNLADYVERSSHYDQLKGFFTALDLHEFDSDAFYQRLLALFSKAQYRNVVIDAPNYIYCQPFIARADSVYLIRDHARYNEECQLLQALAVDTSAVNQLTNKSATRAARHVPALQPGESPTSSAFATAINSLLKEDGLLEY